MCVIKVQMVLGIGNFVITQIESATTDVKFWELLSKQGSNVREKELQAMVYWMEFLENCEGDHTFTCMHSYVPWTR